MPHVSPLSIAFSDPDVIRVGAQLDALDPQDIIIGECSGYENGRTIILGAEDSLLRVCADAQSGQLLGACAVSVADERLAQLLSWVIQRQKTAQSLLTMPFYHPSVEEMLQTALQDIVRNLSITSDLPLGLQVE